MSESTPTLSLGSARLALMETGTKNRSPAQPRQVVGVLTAAYNLLMLSEDILLCLLRFTVSRVPSPSSSIIFSIFVRLLYTKNWILLRQFGQSSNLLTAFMLQLLLAG
jgi:hypothetical protein